MRCPFCASSDDQVIDSRPIDRADVIRRRRACKSCGKRFTTFERLEEMPLMIVKSDHRREPFIREKLRRGILHACEKRPISIDTIDQVVDEVEYELKDYVMEVPSREIGEKVLKKLHAIDQAAYIRFASVYRNFSDVNSFLAEIKKLKSRHPGIPTKNFLSLPGSAASSKTKELESGHRAFRKISQVKQTNGHNIKKRGAIALSLN